jgi:hypothetical protein
MILGEIQAADDTVPKPIHHACQVWRFAFGHKAFGYGVGRHGQILIVAPNPPPSG